MPWTQCISTARSRRAGTLEPLEPRLLLAAGPIISELLANTDAPDRDWIEIHNPTAAPVSLDGWHLTDAAADLGRWTFPAVILEPGGYLVVYATALDRRDPAGELHTNFRLASDGEYLALVYPDGATIAHAYDPVYPRQYEGISYGMAQDVTTLVRQGDALSYHVPTAGDAGLAQTWTAVGYDDSAWQTEIEMPGPSVLVTEAGTGTPDWLEIQNVRAAAVNTAGWVVAVNNGSNSVINAVVGTLWHLPDSMSAGQVLYRTDNTGDNYWGADIPWNTRGRGWVMIVDDQGQVADFVVWGYTAADISGLNVNVNGYALTAADVGWSGDGESSSGVQSSYSLKRTGSDDHNDASDWAFSNGNSRGAANPGLTTPFPGGTTPAVTGIGFDTTQSQFDVTWYKATGAITTLAEAEAAIANPGQQSQVVQGSPAVINYLNTGGTGNFGGDAPFPGTVINTDVDDFAILAVGTVVIPRAGAWTFGVNSDDGFGLELTNRTDPGAPGFTTSYAGLRGASDTLATFDIPQAGTYDLRLVSFEHQGGSSCELFAAEGTFGTFDAQAFHLVGDTGAGGLRLSGLGGSIGADVGAQLMGVNASLWTRIAFNVADPSAYNTMALRMQYNDGFVAFLNGQEIARRKAPASLSWDAAATAARSPEDSALFEEINVTTFLGALVSGTNVLAVHGLNVAAGDGNFLILPELIAATGQDVARYFATPTPGSANLPGFLDFVKDTQFSVDRGVFAPGAPGFDLEITTATEGATIRYTLDGTEPTEASGLEYTGPITIDRTTVLRAVAFKIGCEPSDVDTQTYLFLGDVLTQSPNGEAPSGWPTGSVNGQVLDYGMDPDVVNDPVWGPQMLDALASLPTMSLVTAPANLFDAATGIYVNAGQDGSQWERPVSLELIYPDGTEGFQIDAGLRIRGGYSRSGGNPKHAFRIFFREEYGAAKLCYPLFGDEGVDEFDCIDLRTSQNYSWSFDGSSLNTMNRDVFSRDTMRDMGDPYTRSRYYHLYIDGQYWGLYQTEERSEASFAESYLGGDKEDYDVIKVEAGPYSINATDGTMAAWQELWNLAKAGFATDGAYYGVQGLNADGTRNPALPVYIDVDNLIDYMCVILYTGNKDAPISNFLGNTRPNNFYAIRSRSGDQPFYFITHDAEHTLLVGDLNIDRNGPWPAGDDLQYSNPQWLHQQLMEHPDYRMRFADKVHEYFEGDGLLTPEACTQRFLARAAEIETAIIAESARWGDSKVATPYTKNTWTTTIQDIVNTYLPQRTAIVLEQLRHTTLRDGTAAPLYPSVAVPVFRTPGGQVDPGFGLRMASAGGTIYYTLDGCDPRLSGGAISPAATPYDGSTTVATLIPRGADWKYLDNGSDQGTAWRAAGFNDGAWAQGPAQLGYEDGDEATVIGYGPDANNKYVTSYFRRTFTVTDAEQVCSLTLRLLRDDGAVVYLNGQEVARSNMPEGDIGYQTLAAANVGGADETTFYEFALDPAMLVDGQNILGVEVHQNLVTSSDVSFDLELVAAVANAEPIALTESVLVQARVLDGGAWSALAQAAFFANVPASADNLIVSEINYHPHGPQPEELAVEAGLVDQDFEFIEVRNVSVDVVDLSGAAFSDEIVFTFPTGGASSLGPGESLVVVADLAAFRLRYGDSPAVAGEYTGHLSDGGGQIVLTDRFGQAIADFEYDDSGAWPGRADGNGSSLELLDQRDPAGDYEDADNWRSSAEYGGSPGAEGTGPQPSVVINEVLTHTDLPQCDSVELYNPTAQTIAIGGWFLSDTAAFVRKFRIPDGTVLGAGEYVVFDENDFNPSAGVDPNDFAFSSAYGDECWLVAGDASGRATRFIDHVTFGAARNGESFGRWPNGWGGLYPMVSLTLGTANSHPRVGPVVISEIQYDPGDVADPDGLEFIEIYNPTDQDVDLTEWRIWQGVQYAFPAGQVLGAHQTLVVLSFDPNLPANAARAEAFRYWYAVDGSCILLGGYSGRLDNAGEAVQLQRPDEPPLEAPTWYPRLLEDEVSYDDDAPWPPEAGGTGQSLVRMSVDLWGNDPASWSAGTPTPGRVGVPPSAEDDALETDEDTALHFTAADLLANDVDFSGFALHVQGVGSAGHGALVDHGNQTYTYTPAGNYFGLDGFAYTVGNGHGGSDTGWVRVAVLPVNDPPTARAGDDVEVIDTGGSLGEKYFEWVHLDGSASSDVEGALPGSAFVWREGGVQVGTGAQIDVRLALGEHTLTLVVTDVGGLTDSDDCHVFVAPQLGGPGEPGLALMTPVVPDVCDAGKAYSIRWYGGDASMSVGVLAYGPTGWRMLAQGLSGQLGHYDWQTGGTKGGWYTFVAEVFVGGGGGGATSMVGSPNWVQVSQSPPAPPGEAPAGLPTQAAVWLLTPADETHCIVGEEFVIAWECQIPAGQEVTAYLAARADGTEQWLTVADPCAVTAEAYWWDTTGWTPGRYQIALRWRLAGEDTWAEALSPGWLDLLGN